MLYWAAVFFVIAIIAAVFGFGGIAGAATFIAQIIFFIFLILFVLPSFSDWASRTSEPLTEPTCPGSCRRKPLSQAKLRKFPRTGGVSAPCRHSDHVMRRIP